MSTPPSLWLVAISALAVASPLEAQSRRLVVIDVQVVDTVRDRVVPGLSPVDFEVLDNGDPQRITELHYDDTPLDLVVLEAIGDPTELDAVRQTIDGLSDGFRELRETDRVRLAKLAPRGALSLDSAAGPRAIAGRILRASAGTGAAGPRRLFDGISAAAGLFTGDSAVRRRAILLIADSWESGSKATVAQAISAVLRADATVYVFVLPRTVQPARGAPVPNLAWQGAAARNLDGQSVQPIVAATGGEIIWQDGGRRRAKELVSRLEQRYLLAYPMPQPSVAAFRTVAVTLKEPIRTGKLVRARRGYHPPPRSCSE